MTEHIQRWSEQDDSDFIKSANLYRRFKNVNQTDHENNIKYLQTRLESLGHYLRIMCCNKYQVVKYDNQE